MKYSLLFLGIICYLQSALSSDDNSMEFTPLYDNSIFGDVVDVVNEFNKANSPLLEAQINDNENSEEKYEELLAEYQHYLDKTHQQKINYYEKINAKNQVPYLHHKRLPKSKSTLGSYDDRQYPNSYDTQNKLQDMYNNPTDVYYPMFQLQSMHNEEQPKNDFYDKKMSALLTGLVSNNPYKHNTEYNLNNDETDIKSDKNFNVRVTVEIGVPKQKPVKKLSHDLESRSSDIMTFPLKYFDFLLPMDLYKYDKKNSKFSNNDHEHNLSIHKKKKSRRNNQKHRKKFTTHPSANEEFQYVSIKIQPNLTVTNTENNNSNLNSNKTSVAVNQTNMFTTNSTHESNFVVGNKSHDINKTENSVESEYTKLDSNAPSEKNINLRKKREILSAQSTKTPDIHSTKTKILKAIEYTTLPSTDGTRIGTMINRSTIFPKLPRQSNEDTLKVLPLIKNYYVKPDKFLSSDAELTYWPNIIKFKSMKENNNITKIIVDKEIKKSKLNITKDMILNNRNHTRLLEKVIFGDVDYWNDVDTLVPIFMSFVGKYVKGVLTFCSQTSCHSMKCADKACIHRACTPDERWNQRGHCTGSISTDSKASLESIMDLPSNIAFEIVEILQAKMLGKMFGKVTLCIHSKCISFIASKKKFLKSKCKSKDLNVSGRCPNLKAIRLL